MFFLFIPENKRYAHTASIIVKVGETATFDVTFSPNVAQRSIATVNLTVVDNQYEDSVVQMVGEGYHDDVTFDNIHSVLQPTDPEQEEGAMAEDDIPAARSNHIAFGDCGINEPRTLSFSLTNHSSTDCVRFQWPSHSQLKFSPEVMNL